MTKIPTMFVRDESKNGHPVTDQVKPECQWVLDGEGIATIKLDGTNVKIQGGRPYKRQKPKSGDYDEASYVLCEEPATADRWVFEAFDNWSVSPDLKEVEIPPDGIYELIGPKVQGNPHGEPSHTLVSVVPPHPSLIMAPVFSRTFDDLKALLSSSAAQSKALWGIVPEGIVFHHPDGRMAKIKRRDFGLPWPVQA